MIPVRDEMCAWRDASFSRTLLGNIQSVLAESFTRRKREAEIPSISLSDPRYILQGAASGRLGHLSGSNRVWMFNNSRKMIGEDTTQQQETRWRHKPSTSKTPFIDQACISALELLRKSHGIMMVSIDSITAQFKP